MATSQADGVHRYSLQRQRGRFISSRPPGGLGACLLVEPVGQCTEDGWVLEPDQRHVDLIVRDLGLDDAKGVSAPGEAEQRWDE